MPEEIVEKDLVYAINACVFEVYRHLGHGFLEKVYENALVREFRAREIAVDAQVSFSVKYKGVIVGEYCADLVVDDRVIVEVKAVERLHPAHGAQILNYLKATGKKSWLAGEFLPSQGNRKTVCSLIFVPFVGFVANYG